MGPLPINFEAKLKEPNVINGGYPYSIKAEDLMKNFVDAKLEVDDSIHSSGLQLEEYVAYGDNGHPGRAIRINPESELAVVSNNHHMWKVTQSGLNGDIPVFDVLGGVVTVQGTSVSVADDLGLSGLASALAYVSLKITRDADSRAYDPAELPIIEIGDELPVSTNASEYVILATIAAGTFEITQCRNDEICSYELLLVANGEFALMPFQTNSRNSYAPPLP
jgi:hypothetical protein